MLLHPPRPEVVIVTGKICIQAGEEKGHRVCACCSLSPPDNGQRLVFECSLKTSAVANGHGYRSSDTFRLFILGLHVDTKYCVNAYLFHLFLCFCKPLFELRIAFKRSCPCYDYRIIMW